LLAGVFPVLFQVGNYCFHSALEGHVIRSGTLLVGDKGKPFHHDQGTLPKLGLFFVISGVMAPWRMIAGFFREAPGRAVTAASTDSASS
jgi:hypothetical protein